jgi:RES domain
LIECQQHTKPAINPPSANTPPSQYKCILAGPDTDFPVLHRTHATYESESTKLRSPLFYSSAWAPEDAGYAGYTGGRFDLPGSKGQGTCNTGASPVAALRELLNTKAKDVEIPQSLLEGVSVSRLRLKRQLRLLDVRVDGPGFCAKCMSDMLHKDLEYRLTQAWAAAIRELGFDGIISISTLEDTVNVYVFGPAGVYEGDFEVEDSRDALVVYRECQAHQVGDLPELKEPEEFEESQGTPIFADDFGDALHATMPLT